MPISHHRGNQLTCLLFAVLLLSSGISAMAQNHKCATPAVIPLTSSEPSAKIYIDPPLPGPLASRGVAILQYCAENLHIAPVFGPGAVAASPRVGHVHISVDNNPWVWADASGNPIILQGLPAGSHTVHITLVDANHHPLDHAAVTFEMPGNVQSENGR